MKKIAVYGLGLAFEQYFDLISYKYNIQVLVDGSFEKQGKYYHDILCVSPEAIPEYDIDAVLITPRWEQVQTDISKHILEMLPNMKIIYMKDCFPKLYKEDRIVAARDYIDEYGNKILFEEGVSIHKIQVEFEGCNNKIFIGKNVHVANILYIHCAGNDNVVEIGEGTSIVATNIDVAEQGKVKIGSDCMLSWDIDFFQNANHPVFSLETGDRVNVPKDIIVGDHVWIGKGVGLLAGADIGSGSVVGYRSVVSKKYPKNCTIVGSPAKVIRENICWKRDATGFYPIEHL